MRVTITRNIRLVKDIDLPEVTLSIMDDVRIDEKLASIDPQFARTVDRHELLRDAPYPVAEVRVEVRPASLILFFDLIESLQEISPGTEEARKSFDTLASAMVFSLGEIAIDESHKKLRSAFSKYALNGFFKLIPWAELPPPLEGAECIVFSPGPGFLQRRTFRSRSEETEVRLGSGDFMDPFIPEFRYIDAILTGPTTEIQQTARKSLEWFHASMQEGRRPEAFLRNWIALELFLGEPGKTVEALTRRMAILCKASENPLPELEREVKRLYDLRSRLVHRGENAVSFREIADLRLKYVLSIQIAAALAADRKLTTMRELWDHIDMEYMRAKTGTSQGLRKDGPAPREDTGIL